MSFAERSRSELAGFDSAQPAVNRRIAPGQWKAVRPQASGTKKNGLPYWLSRSLSEVEANWLASTPLSQR
ncbi:hypothetical protein BJL95_08340 [Methylomonas sp. LWB]|nr:hypothetical protein BJL95_08340 [Methylomonas sp. LWB]